VVIPAGFLILAKLLPWVGACAALAAATALAIETALLTLHP
jgi:hypothetical protein